MYIRTKDGRILDFDKLNEVSKLSIDMAEEPIREAHTIEELCDEFVYVRNKPSLEKPLTSLIRDISIIDKVRKKSNTTVYGAVWTDKGLIFVARMNDKGDLELIWKIY